MAGFLSAVAASTMVQKYAYPIALSIVAEDFLFSLIALLAAH